MVYPSILSSASVWELVSQVSVSEKEIAEDSLSSSLIIGTLEGTVCGISPLMFWYWKVLRRERLDSLQRPLGFAGAVDSGSAGKAGGLLELQLVD